MSTTITIPAGLPTKYDNTWGASLIGGFVTAVYVFRGIYTDSAIDWYSMF